MATTNPDLLRSELEFLTSTAHALGDNITSNFMVGHSANTKSDGSLVTAVDLHNNQLFIKEARRAFPDYAIQGEEESEIRANDGRRRFVLDPIDGTFPFKTGVPTSGVLASVLNEAGQPEVSIFYNPHVRQAFTAMKGLGSFINGRQVYTNQEVSEFSSVVAVGMTGPEKSRIIDVNATRYSVGKTAAKIVILGSTGYEISLVGAGQHVGQIFGGETAHDVAAGALFVTEAGGVVTDVFGSPQRYDRNINGAVSAANPAIHEQLLESIRF